MIGVIVEPQELAAVREFFELFKTPWEQWRPEQSYDIVITTGRHSATIQAKLLLIYSPTPTEWDRAAGVTTHSMPTPARVGAGAEAFRIYGEVSAISGHPATPLLSFAQHGPAAASKFSDGTKDIIRVGYNLFAEVLFLLRSGQPAAAAAEPALDRHIAFLRRVIAVSGQIAVEIPPLPAGHPFFACLTHDIDFLSLRNHRFDRTMCGFIWRASVGSLVSFLRGRLPWHRLFRNFAALLKLPWVHLRLCHDFWLPFERYLAVDKSPATFFVVPFKNRPGRSPAGSTAASRATRYDAMDIVPWVKALQDRGCEIAVHGIDAWQDTALGRQELDRVRTVTGSSSAGVRMHWLYFGSLSHQTIENAGFDYDATCGYNDAVGYRAGTAQPFRPLGVNQLLELPFQIQDTSLFYPDRMNLSEKEAWDRCLPLLANALEYGGVITLSWHDRSLVPERLWGDFYRAFLEKVRDASPRFGTAAEIVAWFRRRRSLVFSSVRRSGDCIDVRVENVPPQLNPGFVVRLSSCDEMGRVSHQDAPLGPNGTATFKIPDNRSQVRSQESEVGSRPSTRDTILNYTF
jgi:hypothetical protein